MNKKLRCLLLITLGAATVVIAQEIMTRGHYSLKKTKETTALVANVDLDVVRTNHMAKYELHRKTQDKGGQREMVLYDEGSGKKVELRMTLHPSVADAENNVLDLLNGTSVIFSNGAPSGGGIGDNAWYHTTKGTGATGILFVRRNVVVSLFAQDGPAAEALALKLDADIVAGKNGIALKEVPE